MASTRRGSKRPLETKEDAAPSSPLAILLLQKWSEGGMSAADVQEIALASTKTAPDAQDVHTLSSLGAYGSQGGNIHRDLQRRFFKDITFPDPYVMKTTIFAKAKNGEIKKQPGEMPILLPHMWLAALEAAEKDEVLGTKKLKSFWSQQTLKNPRLNKCQGFLASFGNWKEEGPIPFCIHGDAAPHSECDGLMVLSLRSILCELPVHMSQMLLVAAPKAMITPEMWADVWDVLHWSLEAMAWGRMPKKGVNGKKLPPDLLAEAGKTFQRGMVFCITGDLEWYYQEFDFPRHNQPNPCGWCRANQSFGMHSGIFALFKSVFFTPSPPTPTCCFVELLRTDMPWNDFRSTALWRKSLLTPEELMAAFNHKIFTVSGVNPLALCLDTLHTLDLGVSCHIVGNLLWELIEEMPYNRDISMRKMNEKIQKTYESEGIPAMDRLHAISHSDLRKKAEEYPILKHQKGARVRKFIPVACRLAGEKRDDSDHGKHRHELLLALKEMYELLGKEGFKWQTQEHAKFQAACEKCMKHYQWLAKEAVSKKEFLWSVVQKHHMSQHLVEQSKFIAPKHFHTYGSEGFMKTMKKLAGACLNGTPGHKVPQALLVKYRFFWHLMLSGLIEED